MIEELKFLKKYLLSLADDLSLNAKLKPLHYLFFIIKARRVIDNMKRMLNDLGTSANLQ